MNNCYLDKNYSKSFCSKTFAVFIIIISAFYSIIERTFLQQFFTTTSKFYLYFKNTERKRYEHR